MTRNFSFGEDVEDKNFVDPDIAWLKNLEKIVIEIAQNEGCRLYDLEFVSNTVRVFIDKVPQAGLQECETISRKLSEVLDSNDSLVPVEHYNLEVSTPGLERKLKKSWHFEAAVGKKIKIKMNSCLEEYGVLSESLKKSRNLERTLDGFRDNNLIFKHKEGDLVLPLSGVEKAKVIFELEKKDKNNKK